MKARISVLTIGVDDLERSLKFYRDGLGLSTEGIIGTEFEHGAVAFFDLQAGVKLAIWNRKDLSVEANVPLSPPSSSEFTIGHNVGSKEEVDEVMEQASRAGATVTVPAQDTFWGATPATFSIRTGTYGRFAGILPGILIFRNGCDKLINDCCATE